MGIEEQIERDLLEATKKGEGERRDALRFVRASLQNARISLRTEKLTDEQVIPVLRREVKQRQEAAVAYKQAGANEAANKEEQEAVLIENYLPAQLSQEDIEKVVDKYLDQHKVDVSQMGQAMRDLADLFHGQADLGNVSKYLRNKLLG